MAVINTLRLEERWRHYREPVLLAASGGAIDTISFITLFGLFTAHVTGNFVVAGATLAGESEGIVPKLLAIPFFMVAVAVTTIAIRARNRITPGFLALLFSAEVLLLLMFAFMGYCWSPFTGANDIHALATGMIGVMAMGIRNATTRILLGSTSPSTMMTGNVTQLTIDLLNWFQLPGAGNTDKLKKSGCSVLGFLAGAALGAVGYIYLGFFATLIPILMTAVIIYRELRFSFTESTRGPLSGKS